ncbi:hypothetical protein [Oryza sativa Japonica Group]|uniref:Uncharacterized protein n=2 Tax=Oryza sativa subsp. japonica TaxID=39947 RepID=Q7F513_ORYSJ|nr:hypothetical protein [Oryza sativa Japonica Group]BAC03298.1 hypothetical protein [Oryza sativa Japonica Group]
MECASSKYIMKKKNRIEHIDATSSSSSHTSEDYDDKALTGAEPIRRRVVASSSADAAAVGAPARWRRARHRHRPPLGHRTVALLRSGRGRGAALDTSCLLDFPPLASPSAAARCEHPVEAGSTPWPTPNLLRLRRRRRTAMKGSGPPLHASSPAPPHHSQSVDPASANHRHSASDLVSYHHRRISCGHRRRLCPPQCRELESVPPPSPPPEPPPPNVRCKEEDARRRKKTEKGMS